MAYLSQVRSGGKQYIYLTEYCGRQPYTAKTERHVYGFGNSRIALLKMKRWLRKFDSEFPEQLNELGYTENDLKEWIETLETGITKNGRKFKITRQKRAVY
ncbi:hypothetical protein [Cytobacillus gottheilii]|uniref:hypothetical protein n=1 Tax=Cytobacillus gottheilii TaxID=859144 RepID=UPI00082B1757|nr:hypothetical protein [Cytobacillus gottheilii]